MVSEEQEQRRDSTALEKTKLKAHSETAAPGDGRYRLAAGCQLGLLIGISEKTKEGSSEKQSGSSSHQ